MTDAGGLRTRRRAVGRETILQQSKIDSRAFFPIALDFDVVSHFTLMQ